MTTEGLTRRTLLAAAAAVPALAHAGPTLRVGPQQPIKTLAAAAKEAKDGMLIEVEAGTYTGDVAAWPQNELTLRAVGGRVRVVAAGAQVQGKGLFVTTGKRQRIEGFDFVGARVPDRNGAGIRVEAGSLKLLDCGFEDNENGILTSNDPELELDLENCDFGRIAPGEGLTHNCYVGHIKRLSVMGCYFHHGLKGHLLKSRAATSHVLYNRVTDEIGGRASYELDFPNGGLVVVMGNLISQSSTTENAHLISYGEEGVDAGSPGLFVVNNTMVDQLPKNGIWLRASGQQTVRVVNNVVVGGPPLRGEYGWEVRNNHVAQFTDFLQAAREDYRLRPESKLAGRFLDAGMAGGLPLAPVREYRHPRQTELLTKPARHPGAFQG